MKIHELFERAADEKIQPQYEQARGLDHAIEILKTHCSDALWMVDERKALYRGMRPIDLTNGVGTVDTAATERQSENTDNYYTVILDNNPYMEGFPKRSRSFIGTTSYRLAKDYGSEHGGTYVMIPFNGTKIGIVNKADIWNVKISLFGIKRALVDANAHLRTLRLEENIESFKQFDKELKQKDPGAIAKFIRAFAPKPDLIDDYTDHFLEHIWKAYSPEETGMTCVTSKQKINERDTEIWVGGKILIMDEQTWDALQDKWE